MNTKPPLTADAILDQVRRLARTEEFDPSVVDSYRQAAAVLAAIDEPAALLPLHGAGTMPADRILRRDLVPAPGTRLGGGVMLRHDVRRQALRALGSRERMRLALAANPAERTGPVQEQLERYIQQTAKPIQQQTRQELEATLQVLHWLEGIVDGLPDVDEVRRRLAWCEFTAPFETLAGDDVFRGRTRELDDLRRFVGVLKPETLVGRFRDVVDRTTDSVWTKEPGRPALSVYGPGGVGKSALIARFVLEHSRLAGPLRIPFAYLDFDRPTLDVAEPATLCAEMLRQIALQFPEIAPLAELQTAPAASQVHQTLSRLMYTLETHLGPRPYLIMLDTFEQVQYRGERQALSLWSLFAALQNEWPTVRVVVSGRAPVTTLILADAAPNALEVGDLDEESAIAFVRAAGLRSRDLAEALVRQVGGVPLSLKLAATLLSKEPEADVNVRSRFWLRTADEVIQGQLYERILGHIGDPEVARVAHPGLVLRRITPELLLNVLREPCRLTIATPADAQRLFERLKAEVSLVSNDDPEGALVHRRDLRQVMLKLLKDRAPALAEEISGRAIVFYREQLGTRARAEQTYHELLLGHVVARPVFDDPDVRASIQASITELPLESQHVLASYGFQVDKRVLAKATMEQREASVAEEVEEVLAHGGEALWRVLGRLPEGGRLRHDSPLWRAQARAYFEMGDDAKAAGALERGLRHAIETSNSFRVLELLTDKAWQSQSSGERGELRDTLERLAEYASRHNDATARLQHWLQTQRRDGLGKGLDSDVRRQQVVRLFESVRPRDLLGLLPVTRGLWKVAAATMDGTVFAELILHSESSFLRARVEDRRVQDAMRNVVMAAYEALAADGRRGWQRLAEGLEGLTAVWPYRNIHVYPPQASGSAFAV